MSKEEHAVGTTPPSHTSDELPSHHDSEKGHIAAEPGHAVAGENGVPANLREDDFMTRNGLNLRSFQRRKFYFFQS